MLRICGRLAALSIAVGLCFTSFAAESGSKALRASEVIGLVAGNALPENIVADINADHLAFRPDDYYRGLLKTAGADAKVLAALDFAKVDTEQSPEDESGKALLEEMANAAAAMNCHKYDQAEAELKSALTTSLNSPDVYFVVGDLLRSQGAWQGAATAYEQVLQQDENFPEAEAKLSYILYRAGDGQGAFKAAQAALKENQSSPEAHKNAGLALYELRNFGASELEYKQALRLKPDYWAAHEDWGILLQVEGRWDDSIAEFKKTIALSPPDSEAIADTYYNTGWDYDQLGNLVAAMAAYRQAKTAAPNWYDPRQNLGKDLLDSGNAAQAVEEFRAMVNLFPDAEMCRASLGLALFDVWDFAGAEAASKEAIQMDPTDVVPYATLGRVYEQQKNHSAALAEFQAAEKIDPTYVWAYRGSAEVLIGMKNFADADAELDRAERAVPSDAYLHDLHGQALVGLGKLDSAIAEFQESLALGPRQIQVMLRLADAFEAKGDWVAAMQEYREASLTDAGIDMRGKITRISDRDPQAEYKEAQDRLKAHLAALRVAGKSSEAAEIESAIAGAEAKSGLSEQLDAAMLAGRNADKAHRVDEAITDYQQAVSIAEEIQPHDPRLVTALDDLGDNYLGWNAPAAESAFERELKAAQDLFGPNSPDLAGPLQSLAHTALVQHDYDTAEKFYFQAVDVNEQAFGESSDKVAASLLQASSVYMIQKEYAKAEPYMLRALRIDVSVYPANVIDLAIPLSAVCTLYERWGKPDQLEVYNGQLLVVLEKQYGPNSPVLLPVLTRQAKALRALAKNDEAEKLEDRAAAIRSGTMSPN